MQRRWAPAVLFISMLHLALWTVVAAGFASTQTPAANSIRIAPSNPMLQFSGRISRSGGAGGDSGRETVAGAVSFDHPGVELRLRVRGTTSVAVELLQQRSPPVKIGHSTYPAFQPHYFVVVVNGSVVPGFANATFSTAECQNASATLLTAANGLDVNSVYDLRIFKSSEAQWAASVPSPNWLTLTALVLGGTGQNTHPSESGEAGRNDNPQLLELPPWRPARRLEFVGDSIMAGYCNLLWAPDIDRHKTNRSNIESFWLSWPTRTCEHLGAECHTAAWSGFALTRSHFCNKPVTMPAIWERTLASATGADWDFSLWTPHAVVINLGTNDWHGVPAEKNWSTPAVWSFIVNFTQTYHDFVKRITSPAVYGPTTHVFVAVGPMTLGYLLPAQWVVGNASAKGLKVHLLNQSGFSHGDCGHPSFQSDVEIASGAASAIARELGWPIAEARESARGPLKSDDDDVLVECPCAQALCQPLGRPLSGRNVHVYSDCSSPGSDRCDWHATVNFSAVTTVVDGSKLGGQLMIDVAGGVTWRSAVGDASLICAAHARGVRVLPIVDVAKPGKKGGSSSFTYKAFLSNTTAMERAASSIAAMSTAAGYDGAEFDLEGIGAPYEGGTSSGFDYGTAFVSLVQRTRSAMLRAQPHGRVTVTVGLNNITAPIEKPVFAAYHVVALAASTDGIFVMGYDMWCEKVFLRHLSLPACPPFGLNLIRWCSGRHAHAYCAGPNAPLPTVEENLRGWLAAGVPAEKLILGIPWYGRSYYCLANVTAMPGACSHAACLAGDKSHPAAHGPTFTLWQVEDKLERQMCARGWSDQWGSPYIDCRASAATGGVRTVTWYDDANSTALKAGLAKRLGLGGVGVFTAEMAGAVTEPLAQRTWGALTSLYL